MRLDFGFLIKRIKPFSKKYEILALRQNEHQSTFFLTKVTYLIYQV